MRIQSLLQKITALTESNDPITPIDLDLMLDYTRVLYADLLEWRSQLSPKPIPRTYSGEEPSLDELTKRMYEMEGNPNSHEDTPDLKPMTEIRIPGSSSTVSKPLQIDKEELNGTATPAEMKEESPDAPSASSTSFHSIPIIQRLQTTSADIRSFIGINDKYLFMSELFGNDKAAYEHALDTINLAEHGEAATKWLQERLWIAEEQQEIAQSFYEIIRQFKS